MVTQFNESDVPAHLQLPPLRHMLELPVEQTDAWRQHNKRVGVTFGAFDLLHAGHMIMLREAKQNCDFLFVGLQVNPATGRPSKNEPSESLLERQWRLDSNKYVDAYAMYRTEAELELFLSRYARHRGGFIDVRFLDEEYQGKPYTGKGLPIDVYFNWRGHPFSTTNLRKRVADAEHAKLRAA